LSFLLAHWQQPQFAPLLHGWRLFFVCEQHCTSLSSSDGVTVDVSDVPDLHSSQEEADTRIILHCMYMAQNGDVQWAHLRPQRWVSPTGVIHPEGTLLSQLSQRRLV